MGAISLQAQGVTYIQIAHNCSDPGLDTLDIYFNGQILDSNVVYHAATGLFSYPADSAFTIAVAYQHSNGNVNNAIGSFTFTPTQNDNQRNAFIISGINGSGFAPNPNGLGTGISIQVVAGLDSVAHATGTLATDTSIVAIRFLNGVTDLPAIKMNYRNGGAVFADTLAYGSSTADVNIRHQGYEFQLTSADSSQNFGTFYADLSSLSGQPVIVFTSGFLNPAYNNYGPSLGLYALLNTGAIITFQPEYSGFQFLNNCADPAADSVDVYINGSLAFQSLGFRNATPAFALNAYAAYNIGLAPKNSASVADTFWHQSFFFPRDTFFIATAAGLLSQTGFASNPDGINTDFNVLIKNNAELAASASTDFDFYMINGVTDAPALNLQASGGPVLLSNVEYAGQTNYVSLPSETYSLVVQNTSGNSLLSGDAGFTPYNAESGVLLTSGFLNPADNNNGPGMGLYFVTTTGGPFVPISGVSGIKQTGAASDGVIIFPNPATNRLNILFNLPQPEIVSLAITDVEGNIVKQVLHNENLAGAQHVTVNTGNLSAGFYLCRVVTSTGISNYRFVITR